MEWGLLISAIILSIIGIIALFSATQETGYEEFQKQIIWVAVSLVAMVIVMLIDYEVLVKICNLFNIGLDEIFSGYLNIKGKREINSALFGFDKLKPNNQDTIIHMIEYFNKSNVS